MRVIAKISFATGFLSEILLFQILPPRSFPSISIALIYLPLRLELKNARLIRTWIDRNIDAHEFIGSSNISFSIIISSIEEESLVSKKLKKITDILGRETKQTKQPIFYIYDDGTVEKKLIIE